MTFLSPWSALFAAAVAIPLLLLLYFLRLRRQRLRVPSTLLWEKSFEDLQANAPFQRLRWSLLLILQLLLLFALLLALAQPVMRGAERVASRVVLLIDHSASMNATVRNGPANSNAPPRSRLDLARDAARKIVNDLHDRDEPGQMMIISFGSTAQVVSTYESNRDLLLDAIDSIQPTDEQSDLNAALQLAGAFAASRDERENQPPQVLLLSDGVLDGANTSVNHQLRAGAFTFVQVVPQRDEPIDNVGIASFSVRRQYEDPTRVLVFARLINAGLQPVETVLTLWANDQAITTIRKTIPAADAKGPGEESFTHAIDSPGGAALTLRQNHRDELPDDDVAWLVLPPPAQPRIAIVHPNDSEANPFLHDLLAAAEPKRLDSISADAYANLDAPQLDSGSLYDLIVFDRVAVSRLPGVPTMTFGATPAPLKEVAPPASAPATTQPASSQPDASPQLVGRRILSWDRQNPVMRNVSLDTIVYAGFGGFDLPAGATSLAFGPDGPVIVLLRTRGANHLAVGFDLLKSNWPVHVSSAVFMQNAIDFLTLANSGVNGLTYRAGDPITVRVQPNSDRIVIDGPVQSAIAVEPGSLTTLPPLRLAGLYRVKGTVSPFDRIAVSVLSDVESDIRPNDEVVVNAENAGAARAASVANRPLWPWLIAAAFALMVVEWLVYCRRARG